MSTEELQKRTTVNIQEKANLIWAIADKLVGTYKPHEYGNVILPMCVIKRFSDTLAPTKEAVLKANKVCEERGLVVRKGFLTTASGYDFYNISPFTFEGLLSDAENIADNFRSYLNHFSENVVDIIEKFDFDKEITKLDHNGILYNVIQEFCSKKAYMGADEISAVDMGYIFEELVRKFSESYDEQAGAHFTARDIIYLMTELLVAPQRETLAAEGVTATVYDMAMGTSQMLDCLSEKLLAIDEGAQITEFGQELNEQTFAIAKANVLIKGGDADNMRHGNTLSDDKFEGYTFDYIISNPPFGIPWKREEKEVTAEHKRAFFESSEISGPELPLTFRSFFPEHFFKQAAADHQDNFLPIKLMQLDFRQSLRKVRDSKIQGPLLQKSAEGIVCTLGQFHADFGKNLLKRLNCPGKQDSPSGRCCTDAQNPFLVLRNVSELPQHGGLRILETARISKEHFSCIGQFKRNMTDQELTAQFLFQTRNMGAERLLCDVQLLRSFREAPLSCQYCEILHR